MAQTVLRLGPNAALSDPVVAVLVTRRGQIGVRIVLALVAALAFQALTGPAAVACWFGIYTLLQIVETLIFRRVDRASPASRPRKLLFLGLLFLNNIVFGALGILLAQSAGAWGLICAVLTWSGAMLNAAMISGESSKSFAVAMTPPVLYFGTVPSYVLGNGGSVPEATAIIAAGIITASAATAIWASSRRLMSYAARERETARLALLDPETGLPNHAALLLTADALERGRDRTELLAAAAIGIARFDSLYAAIGHGPMNDLLCAVAARLRQDPGVQLGRPSQAMFTAVWLASDQAAARQRALAFHRALEDPIIVNGTPVDVDIVIGLSVGTDSAVAPATPIVDRAVLAANRGRMSHSQLTCFDSAIHVPPAQNLSLMSQMLRALNEGDIDLHYQPKLKLASNRVTAVEALLRWRHPEHGWLGPNEFVPLAEETGHIAALTEWTLRRAINDQRTLYASGYPLAVAVNLSSRILNDFDFISRLARIADTAPGAVCFEITETAIVEHLEIARTRLGALNRRGNRLSIDDFGSGQTSLAYLKHIPARELKIDKSFISDIDKTEGDRVLVSTIVDLAHNLGMEVVAEGVESDTVAVLLAQMGCDIVQGYHVARPMPLIQLVQFLDQRDTSAEGGSPQALLPFRVRAT